MLTVPPLPTSIVPSALTDPRIADAIMILLSSLSARSRPVYIRYWTWWSVWARSRSIPILAARPRDVVLYIEELRKEGYKRASYGVVLTVIRSVYRALVVNGLIDANPAIQVRPAGRATTQWTPVLSEAQIRAIVRVTKGWRTALFHGQLRPHFYGARDCLTILLLLGLGLRVSEIVAIRIEDLTTTVDGRPALKVLAKGGKPGAVSIPTWLQTHIQWWRSAFDLQSGPLLPRYPKAGAPMTKDMARAAIKRAAEEAGVPKELATPHAIRRAYVTITGQRGVSLEDRQHAVLHSRSSTTAKYDKAIKGLGKPPGDVLEDLVK